MSEVKPFLSVSRLQSGRHFIPEGRGKNLPALFSQTAFGAWHSFSKGRARSLRPSASNWRKTLWKGSEFTYSTPLGVILCSSGKLFQDRSWTNVKGHFTDPSVRTSMEAACWRCGNVFHIHNVWTALRSLNMNFFSFFTACCYPDWHRSFWINENTRNEKSKLSTWIIFCNVRTFVVCWRSQFSLKLTWKKNAWIRSAKVRPEQTCCQVHLCVLQASAERCHADQLWTLLLPVLPR